MALQLRTLVNAFQVDLRHEKYENCIARSLEALELATGLGHPLEEVLAHLNALRSFTAIGDLDQAREHSTAILVPAERLRHRLAVKGFNQPSNPRPTRR